MAGRGSLAGLMPYGDANAIVMEMARRGAAGGERHAGAGRRVRHRPVPADAAVPAQVRDAGFAGVQNFPTVGLIDGTFRANLEETGMGYDLEVEMIREAASMELLTAPTCSTRRGRGDDRAGADVLVPHMGLTTKGTIGAQTALTLDECVERIQAMRDAASAVNPDVIVLCHGGPIAEPEDAQYVLEHTRAWSASSARPAWSACRPRWRSPRTCAVQGARDSGGSRCRPALDPGSLPTMSFDWGAIKWLVAPENTTTRP